VIETPVGLIDIIPTIIDLAGRRIPTSIQGITLLPAIREGAPTFDRPPVYLETWKSRISGKRTLNLIAVVRDKHKLIMDDIKKTFSLYELEKDPMETSNLLENPSVSTDKLFHRLGGYLLGWRDIKR
jgi:arylsulfatase A-like enzyme